MLEVERECFWVRRDRMRRDQVLERMASVAYAVPFLGQEAIHRASTICASDTAGVEPRSPQ